MRTSFTVRAARLGALRISLIVLLSFLIAACASGGASAILSTVGGPVGNGENAYAGGEPFPSAAASAAPAAAGAPSSLSLIHI